VFTAYRIPGMPTTYFVNRAGIIESAVIGGVTPEQLEQEIEAIVN
jgi:DNA-binding transcriptional regulator YdaS (Cro superfamily)